MEKFLWREGDQEVSNVAIDNDPRYYLSMMNTRVEQCSQRTWVLRKRRMTVYLNIKNK